MRPATLPTTSFATDLVDADRRASEGAFTQADYEALLRGMRDGDASVSAMQSLDDIARRAGLALRSRMVVAAPPTHRWDPVTKRVTRL